MKKLLSSALQILILVLSLYWIIFTFVEYLNTHTTQIGGKNFVAFIANITDFRYWKTLFLLAIALIIWLTRVSKPNWEKLIFYQFRFKGIFVPIALNLFSLTIILAYGNANGIFQEIGYVKAISFFLFKLNLIALTTSFVVWTAYLCGNWVNNLFGIQTTDQDRLQKILFEITIGIVLYTLLTFLLGAFGLLRPEVCWPIITLLLIFRRKVAISSLQTAFFKEYLIPNIDYKEVLLFVILFTTFSLTLLLLGRPFPIGWDDLGVYMNIPNLLAQKGTLIGGSPAYNWSLFMSLGFVLFKSAQTAMTLSWVGGVLSSLALYNLSLRFLKRPSAILITTLFTTLPAIVFQLSKDMKVDLGLLFITLVILNTTLTLVEKFDFAIPSIHPESKPKSLIYNLVNQIKVLSQTHFKDLAIIGILCGYAFGIKYTSFIFILAISSIFAFELLGSAGLILWTGASMFISFQTFIINFSGITISKIDLSILTRFGLVLSTFATLWIILKAKKIVNLGLLISIMATIGIFSLISFSPWMIRNYLENQDLSFSGLLHGRSQAPYLDIKRAEEKFALSGIQLESVTPLKYNEVAPTQPVFTGVTEEVRRYAGYEDSITRYITLPYDVVMNTNVKGQYVTIGFILISLLPLLFAWRFRNEKPILTLLLLVALLGIGSYSFISGRVYQNCVTEGFAVNCLRNTIDLAEKNYPINTSIINLIPKSLVNITSQTLTSLQDIPEWTGILLIITISAFLFALYLKIDSSTHGKALMIFATSYGVMWILFAGGIYWYGITGFAILFLLSGIWLSEDLRNDKYTKALYTSAHTITTLWIIFAFFAVFYIGTNTNQQIFSSTIGKYLTRPYSKTEAIRLINSAYPQAIEEINSHPEAYVYRIGTFITYFIDNNDTRIYNDSLLDNFNSLYSESKSKEEIATKLKLENFRYLVIDLNTTTIDKTEEKSLKLKFDKLIDFTLDNPFIRLISTDRVLEVDPKLGQSAENKEGATESKQKVIESGSIAVFELI